VTIWDSEIVPTLTASPGLRSVAILEAMDLRDPQTYLDARRTMERRNRAWRADHGPPSRR
jgi:hypothetical protein